MTLQQEIDHAVRTFRALGVEVEKNIKRATALGGYYFLSAAEAAAPVGTRVHKRYNTAKVSRAIRAPKGMGNVTATYMPGNLARSLRILPLNRVKNGTIIGAKLNKGATKGTFQGNRVDGYYFHMVEGGTRNWSGKPFFLATWNRTEPRVSAIVINELQKTIARFVAQNAVNNGQLSLFP